MSIKLDGEKIAEQIINKFKDTSVEIIQPEEQRDKRLKKNGQSLRDV